VVEAAREGLGLDTTGSLRLAFAIVLALDALTYAWFVYGWRRHSHPHAHAARAD
jgi:ABC-type transporter Mla maintaining outer membrane lipid asymmetry permease subunit MlaE